MPPLTNDQAHAFMRELDSSWRVADGQRIVREFSFSNFKKTMVFVNKVAEVAEEEGHHPDMIVSYGKVIVELWTHAIGGLSENDFIVAAKIDTIQ